MQDERIIIIAKDNHRKHNSRTNYNMLVEKSRLYKKEIKKHKNRMRDDLITKLNRARHNNPRQYWQLLTDKKQCSVNASIEDLFKHYKNLGEGSEAYLDNVNIETLTTDLDVKTLNEAITEKEKLTAVNKL